DISRRGVAGNRGSDEQPEQSADHGRGGDHQRRVQKHVSVARVIDVVGLDDAPGHKEQRGEIQPGGDPARLVSEFEPEDLAELHAPATGCGRARCWPKWPAMVLKYTSVRSGSMASKSGPGESLS